MKPTYNTKICAECNNELDVALFTWFRRKRVNGVLACYAMSKCRKCIAAVRKGLWANDPKFKARVTESSKRWREANPEKHKLTLSKAAAKWWKNLTPERRKKYNKTSNENSRKRTRKNRGSI